MADEYLFCNFNNCNVPITKYSWITRCSHVFCEDHGNAYFLNKSSKVKCPACNESNTIETDVIKSNLNPHDLLLCCVRPEKVLEYVINASKVWSYQMRQKKKFNMEMLSEKYEKIATDAMAKLKAENSDMRRFIIDIEEKLKSIEEELVHTKKRLWKYKMAYKNLRSQNVSGSVPHEAHQTFFSDFNNDEGVDREVEDLLRYGRFNNTGQF